MLSSPSKLNSATNELVPDDHIVNQHAAVSTTDSGLDLAIQIVDAIICPQSGQASSIEQTPNANDLVTSPDSFIHETKSAYPIDSTPSREPRRHAKTKGQLKKQLLKRQQQSAKTTSSVTADKTGILSSVETLLAESKDAMLGSLSSASTMDLKASKQSVSENNIQKSLTPVVPETKQMMENQNKVYLVGELLWGRVSGHPWWPCMATYDPISSACIRQQRKKRQYHVQFFGIQKERGWISPRSLMVYEGRAAFEALVKLHSDWAVSPKRQPLWEIAVADADRAVRMTRLERIKQLTFVYDSILPAHVWSNLPPTPAETPVCQKSRGGKRKTVCSVECSNSVTTHCIDMLDDLAPPSKKRKKSVTACESNTVKAENDDMLVSEIKVESVENCQASKRRSQSRTKNPPENNERKQRDGSIQSCSPRKGLRSSFVYVDGLPEPLSSDNNQFENSSMNIDVSKSPEKQLLLNNETTSCSSSKSTRQINSKVIVEACNQITVAVSERDLVVDSEEQHKDMNTSPMLDIGRKLRPSRKSEPKDQASPLPINGISVSAELQLQMTTLQPTRGLHKSLTTDQLLNQQIDGGGSTRRAASGRRSSLSRVASTHERCVSLEGGLTTDNKVKRMSVRRRNSLPSSAVEKPEVISNGTRTLDEKNKISVEDTGDEQPKSSPIVGKKKARVKVRAHRKLSTLDSFDCDVDQRSDVPSQSCSSTSMDNSALVVLQRTAARLDEHCSICEQTSDSTFVQCYGPCLRMFHNTCIGLVSGPAYLSFTCDECTTGLHTCFGCGQVSSDVMHCSASPPCGKFYHRACAAKFVQTRFEKNRLYCPLHTCGTCFANADDDEDDLRREATKGRLYRCARCPTAYHTNDLCIAAGSVMLKGNSITCSRHFVPDIRTRGRYHARVNVSWCFQCSKGGTLLCCDSCPAAYHAECLEGSPSEQEGAWYCKDCRLGRQPHYGDIVWVKLGSYRWWPCEICLPQNVPDNILAMPHDVGEFPVRFFGTNEYYWTFKGRVFHFQEGDKGSKWVSSKSLDKVFSRAVEEAKTAFGVWASLQIKREEALIEKCNKKPAPYKRVKCNVPLGGVEIPRVNINELPYCQCRPTNEDPCGPDSDCINRHMLYECHPSVCPNGDRCLNQRFQQRQYPAAKSFRTDKRGWGLIACVNIQKGQFVSEYVGDLIDEAECKRRLEAARSKNVSNFYMLTLDKNRIIDAGPKGNLSRFMNHSCKPNCETQKWNVNGDVRVGLFAIEDIAAGTELTFNYRLDCYGNEKTVCRCGTDVCSGFIGVRPKTSTNTENDQKADKRRKKKKSRRVPTITVEGQNNGSSAVEKKENAVGKGRRSRGRPQLDCFICHEELNEQDVVTCDYKRICGKMYHLRCVQLTDIPKDRWSCPRHNCCICDRHAVALCGICTTSYCRDHLVGNIVDLSPHNAEYSNSDFLTFSTRRIRCLAHASTNSVDRNAAGTTAADKSRDDQLQKSMEPRVTLPTLSMDTFTTSDEGAGEKAVSNQGSVFRRSRRSADSLPANEDGVQQKRLSSGTRKRAKKDCKTEENYVATLITKCTVNGWKSDVTGDGLDIAVEKIISDSSADGSATKSQSNRKRSHLASLNDDLSVNRHAASELIGENLALAVSASVPEKITVIDTSLSCLDKVSLIV